MSRIVDTYPLSPLQEGMLFNALYAPHSGIDIEQILIRTSERLDPKYLSEAWNMVAARHDILRTGFRWEGFDQPMQLVNESAEVPFSFDRLCIASWY